RGRVGSMRRVASAEHDACATGSFQLHAGVSFRIGNPAPVAAADGVAHRIVTVMVGIRSRVWWARPAMGN
ncbi:hypothetical protein, partial [Burkholderia multivorans]|uniref:hypothetical protein n=1 Tax=Burkholderia multivorans TaxID=87883 RepID=UPI0019553B9E